MRGRALLLTLATAGLTSACEARPAPPEPATPSLPAVAPGQSFTERDNGSAVVLAEPVFRVSLPANRTTAYSWRLDPSASRGVGLIEGRYVGEGSGAVGAGGTEVFTLHATAAAGVVDVMETSGEPRPEDRRFTLRWRLRRP